MNEDRSAHTPDIIGDIPNRLALAGGWIDQPFVSQRNPSPPGSMVVVSLEPTFLCMDRCGFASSTRKVALRLWNGELPVGDRAELVRELYEEENRDRLEPSGSQDMIGLIYPGISRLDFDFDYQGGVFPRHVESNTDADVAHWLETVMHMLPIAQRSDGYNPLEIKNLDPDWIGRLGESGKSCFRAIVNRDLTGLGESMNECMECWETILPNTVQHRALTVDLKAILKHYQGRYAGAMYSGCGGGYLFVISEEPVPGGIKAKVRIAG